MAIKVFPSANAVGGVGQKVLKETLLTQWAQGGMSNYVIEGFTVVGSPGATTTIAPGKAIIAGRFVESTANIDVACAAQTGYIALVVAEDVLGNATGCTAEWSDTPPTGRLVLLLQRITYAGSAYSARDIRNTSPYHAPLMDLLTNYITYETYFDSLDAFQLETGTGGSVTLVAGDNGVGMSTGTTANNTVTLYRGGLIFRQTPLVRGLYERALIRCTTRVQTATDCAAYIGVGAQAADHVGISYSAGAWKIDAKNGATNYLSAGALSVATARTEMLLEITEATITLYSATYDPIVLAWTPPSGIPGSLLIASITTTTSASRSLYLHRYSYMEKRAGLWKGL